MNKKLKLFYLVFIFIFTSLLTSSKFNVIKPAKQHDYYVNCSNLKNLKIISHRAKYVMDDPENSITGIRDSIKHKLDYAEIDVQETKDGVVVLMHDKNLKRLTGKNADVDNLTYAQINRLRIKPPNILTHKPEKIPTLEQAMAESKGKINLIIEIKPYGNTRDLTKNVVTLMEKYDLVNGSIIHSMSYNVLCHAKLLNSKIVTGYIVVSPMKHLPEINVDFYSIEDKFITKHLIKQIHKNNKKVYVWTVDNLPSMYKFTNYSSNGIISDDPVLLLNAKKLYLNKNRLVTNE